MRAIFMATFRSGDIMRLYKNTRDILDVVENYREPLNISAIFSDETLNFVSDNEPNQGDEVTISIRCAAGNCDAVYLCNGGNILDMTVKSGKMFDTYSALITVGKHPVSYYFTIEYGGKKYFYNRRGLFPDCDRNFNFMLCPGYKTPDWAKGATFYQIFVDRFYNGDKSNDVCSNEYVYLGRAAKRAESWDSNVMPDDVCTFFGGDLSGIAQKLGYLKNLGIDAIYLNPIFVSPSSHKYDTQDYGFVDPHFGTIVHDEGDNLVPEKLNNKFATKYISRVTDTANLEASNRLLADLIAVAHDKGIKVVLDGVFNHCGAFNRWLDREGLYMRAGYEPGAYRSADSPYRSYFKWYGNEWPNNDCYDGWWGYDNHPKLNYKDSPELFAYMTDIAAKWVSPPYNADGWRLDVAADLGDSADINHSFWSSFRKSVKTANPDAIIIAEHYGCALPWLNGREWDTVMNYDAFMEPLTWFFTGMEKHSERYCPELLNNSASFEAAVRYHDSLLPIQARQTAMNELSNHDHSRFLTRTNMTVGRLHTLGSKAAECNINRNVFMSAVVMQMTWTGCPTVYYGDEAGLCGWTDPDNRRPFPWGNEDKTLYELHRFLIALRKRADALKIGSLEYLFNEKGVISYGRWIGKQKYVVIINNNSYNLKVIVPVWKIEASSRQCSERILLTGQSGFSTVRIKHEVIDGMLYVTLGAHSTAVYEL